jgi:hypothetical protein
MARAMWPMSFSLVTKTTLGRCREELDAAHHRQVPVEQDSVRHGLMAGVEGAGAIFGFRDRKTEILENPASDLADHA